MINVQELDKFLDGVNEKIDIPFIGEKPEKYIYASVTCFSVIYLYEKLGVDITKYLTTEDVLDFDNEEDIVKGFTKFLNEHLDIPIIGEKKEEVVFETIVTELLSIIKSKVKIGDKKNEETSQQQNEV